MSFQNIAKKKPLIFIIDDIMENVKIIGSILLENGYDISMANNGHMALNMIDKISPDLILLDIMMPDINGFEVCKRFKSIEKTKNIPVIFLTARSDSDDIIKGFKLGGVDYITKPFNAEELVVRVKTHIDLKLSKDLIIEQNDKLKKLNEEKNVFLGIAAHDLKNPLTGMMVSNDALIKFIEKLSKEEILDFADSIKSSGRRMLKIINNLLDINSFEEGKIKLNLKKIDLNKVIGKVIREHEHRTAHKKINVHFESGVEWPVFADEDKAEQIFDNLFSNAVKFSPFEKNITINAKNNHANEKGRKFLRLEIKDEGPGFTEEDKKKLFMKFTRLSATPTDKEGSTGLGLSIVKRLVDEMNGNIACESEYGNGAVFIVDLPLEEY